MMMASFIKVTTALSLHRALICLYVLAGYIMRNQLVMSLPISSTLHQCNTPNKNPCELFPDLCSVGGGRCVFKGPCEYQCVCPPDDRVARDCTSDTNLEPGLVVDSLIIFPKDLFSDIHAPPRTQALIARPAQPETEAEIIISTTPAAVVKDDVTTSTPNNSSPHSLRPRLHKKEAISADEIPQLGQTSLASPTLTTIITEDADIPENNSSSSTIR